MTRSWTSRHNAGPEWLISAGQSLVADSTVVCDVERAPGGVKVIDVFVPAAQDVTVPHMPFPTDEVCRILVFIWKLHGLKRSRLSTDSATGNSMFGSNPSERRPHYFCKAVGCPSIVAIRCGRSAYF